MENTKTLTPEQAAALRALYPTWSHTTRRAIREEYQVQLANGMTQSLLTGKVSSGGLIASEGLFYNDLGEIAAK